MAKVEFKTKDADGKELDLTIVSLTPEIKLESNKYYNKAWQEALSNDFPLQVEIEKILQKRGLLNDDKDLERVNELEKQLRSMEKELRAAIRNNKRMTKKEGKILAMEMRKIRVQLQEVGRTKNELISTSAETYADNERYSYFLYSTTVYTETGDSYWKSYLAFKSDTGSPVYADALKAFLKSISGIDLDVESRYYENQWLKRFGFMDEKFRLVNDSGRLISDEGLLIDEEGRFVDEEGNRIDRFGNRLNDKGEILVDDGWVENSETAIAVESET